MKDQYKLFAENYLANGYNARDAYFSAFPNADNTFEKARN